MSSPLPEAEERYNPISPRKRVLIVLMAVATALIVGWLLFERPGGPKWKGKPDKMRCAPGQTHDCVGGVSGVIGGPQASSAASAPR